MEDSFEVANLSYKHCKITMLNFQIILSIALQISPGENAYMRHFIVKNGEKRKNCRLGIKFEF